MTLSKSRILYVDDDSDACEMLKFLLELEDERHDVTSVSTIPTALALIEGQTFDLYILDQQMPLMTGIEICRLIRQTKPQIPVVFYSAMARDADRHAALAAGANEYLVKPNDLEKLTDTVKKLLNKNLSNSTNNNSNKIKMRDRIRKTAREDFTI